MLAQNRRAFLTTAIPGGKGGKGCDTDEKRSRKGAEGYGLDLKCLPQVTW
jgi:hypothetical protein